jgi:hypothetical protein
MALPTSRRPPACSHAGPDLPSRRLHHLPRRRQSRRGGGVWTDVSGRPPIGMRVRSAADGAPCEGRGYGRNSSASTPRCLAPGSRQIRASVAALNAACEGISPSPRHPGLGRTRRCSLWPRRSGGPQASGTSIRERSRGWVPSPSHAGTCPRGGLRRVPGGLDGEVWPTVPESRQWSPCPMSPNSEGREPQRPELLQAPKGC